MKYTLDIIKDLAGLWLIFLEAGVALGLLGFIVWWTWPSKTKPTDDPSKRD